MVGVAVGNAGVEVATAVGTGVAVGVCVGVGIGVSVGVDVEVDVGCGIGVLVGSGVWVDIEVDVTVGDNVMGDVQATRKKTVSKSKINGSRLYFIDSPLNRQCGLANDKDSCGAQPPHNPC